MQPARRAVQLMAEITKIIGRPIGEFMVSLPTRTRLD
jgi:hypothetical protein